MTKREWIFLLIVIAAFAVGAWAYPQLPAVVVSHWGLQGQPNGTMSSFWGVFLFPLIMLGIAIIFWIIPRVDPKRENIAKFRKYYDWFVISLLLFFFWVFVVFLAWNFNHQIPITFAITVPLCGLLWIAGMFLPHTELNWTVGIRTPWTISSEHVWKKTHELGGLLFKISALIGLIGILFGGAAIWFLITPVLASAIGLVVYSYVLYEGERKK